jgi:hypothetical protein
LLTEFEPELVLKSAVAAIETHPLLWADLETHLMSHS